MRSKTDFYRLFFEQLARRGFDVKRSQSSDYIADIYFKNQLVAYGNNRYSVSNIDQWLNSAAASWYSAQHSADAPPTSGNVWNGYNPYDTEAGFLANFEADFRNAIHGKGADSRKQTI